MDNVQRYLSNEPVHRLNNLTTSHEDLRDYVVTLELVLMKVADTATFANPEDQTHFEGILEAIHRSAEVS